MAQDKVAVGLEASTGPLKLRLQSRSGKHIQQAD
jgi:hypothetical protein